MLDNLVFAGLLVTIIIAAIANVIAVKAPRTKQIPKELLDVGTDYGVKPYPGESLRSFKRAIVSARKDRARVFAKRKQHTQLLKDSVI